MYRRRALYTKVVLFISIMALSVFAFIMFLMPEKVELEFQYNINGYTPIENIRIMAGERIGSQKLDANYTVYDYLTNPNNPRIYIPGYRFDGWFLKNGEQLTPDTTFSRSSVVEARYTPYKYQIEFNLGEQAYTTPYVNLNNFKGIYNFDTTIALPASKNEQGQYLFGKGTRGLENDDYVLNKWIVEPLSGTKPTLEYEAGGNFKIDQTLITGSYVQINTNPDDLLRGTITIKPTWKHQEVIVVLTLPMSPSSPVEDETYILDRITFVKGLMPPNTINAINETIKPETWEGDYKHTDFIGWYEDENYTTPIDLSTYNFHRDKTIYAKFDYKTYVLEFDLTGGKTSSGADTINAQNVKYNDDINLIMPEPPLKQGYRFDGWVTEGVRFIGDEEYEFDYTKPIFEFENKLTNDVKLFARWIKEKDVDLIAHPEANPQLAKDYFNYQITVNGVRITGVKTNPINWLNQPRDVVLPSKMVIEGVERDVVEIGDTAFTNNNIKSITISNNVTVISPTAFNVGVSSNLQNIYVNSYNNNFKDIDGVLYNKAGTHLLRYPTGRNVNSILIGREGANVTTISQYAFFNASRLQSIILNVEEIQSYAFKNTGTIVGSTALEEITFTTRVTTVGVGVFTGLTVLKKFNLPASDTSFEFDGRALYQNKNGGSLIFCLPYYNQDYTVKNSVLGVATQYILEEAFVGSRIPNIALPNTVIEIHKSAFAGNLVLTSIKLSENLVRINERAFQNCVALTNIIIPLSVTQMETLVFEGCAALTIYARAESKPTSWANDWNAGRIVNWNYKGQ